MSHKIPEIPDDGEYGNFDLVFDDQDDVHISPGLHQRHLGPAVAGMDDDDIWPERQPVDPGSHGRHRDRAAPLHIVASMSSGGTMNYDDDEDISPAQAHRRPSSLGISPDSMSDRSLAPAASLSARASPMDPVLLPGTTLPAPAAATAAPPSREQLSPVQHVRPSRRVPVQRQRSLGAAEMLNESSVEVIPPPLSMPGGRVADTAPTRSPEDHIVLSPRTKQSTRGKVAGTAATRTLGVKPEMRAEEHAAAGVGLPKQATQQQPVSKAENVAPAKPELLAATVAAPLVAPGVVAAPVTAATAAVPLPLTAEKQLPASAAPADNAAPAPAAEDDLPIVDALSKAGMTRGDVLFDLVNSFALYYGSLHNVPLSRVQPLLSDFALVVVDPTRVPDSIRETTGTNPIMLARVDTARLFDRHGALLSVQVCFAFFVFYREFCFCCVNQFIILFFLTFSVVTGLY